MSESNSSTTTSFAPGDSLGYIGSSSLLLAHQADVAQIREKTRIGKWRKWGLILAPITAYFWYRIASGHPIHFGLPFTHLTPTEMQIMMPLGLIVILVLVLGVPMLAAGKSPHVTYRPEEIDTKFDDVRGMGSVKGEIVRSLNLFLSFKTFKEQMGGTPRRGILFEGPPGTGKTFMAKAMASEAGVPFLFVSATAFQSMYYGQTGRKLRAFFRALRKTARQEGGAIGFIEEIDAIAGSRQGMGGNGKNDGISGVVNEILIQMQSFDEQTRGQKFAAKFIDRINTFLPATRQIKRTKAKAANVLIIAATNRADNLDAALLRPGRFDRQIYFGAPNREGRLDILSYYLDKKAHAPDLDVQVAREQLAAATAEYTPVMLENLLDEGLMTALRHGRNAMTVADLSEARMIIELGLAQEGSYTQLERNIIATHEAGHALVAHLNAPTRKLEVLSIFKRRDALGLLAHSEVDERFTRTKSEMISLIEVAMGGKAAEEVFFGEAGTGPTSDLAAATSMAAMMVGACGMGDSLISYEPAQFGGAGNLIAKVLSTDSTREEVDGILTTAMRTAKHIIEGNRPVIEALRDALLERDELVGDEITDVIEAALAASASQPVTASV